MFPGYLFDFYNKKTSDIYAVIYFAQISEIIIIH